MRLLKVSNIFWGVVLLLLLILSICFAYISTDAPYYLSVARDIANGHIPYKDIFSSYTPLMMYLNSLVYEVLNDQIYHVYLFFQFLIIGVSVGFFYQICREMESPKIHSAFLSLFLFLAVLSSDGTYINLEVYVIMFTFIAFYLLLKRKLFWCGFFLALGFFSKQYGIFNFLPFLLLVIIYHGYQKKYLVKFLLGGLLPLIFFLIYFVFIQQVSLNDLVMQLTGSGYDQEMIELETTWFRFLAGSKIFILLLLPLGLLRIDLLKDRINAILVLGLLVNLVPLWIQTVSHYFILSFPYIFLLMARNHTKFDRKFILISNAVLIVISGLLFTRIFRYKNVYEEQLSIAEKYRKVYPEGSEVFLYKGYRFLYILNDYQNPVLKDIGYRYGFKPDEEFREKYEVISDRDINK